MAPVAKVPTLLYAAKQVQFIVVFFAYVILIIFSFISYRYSTFLLLYVTGITSEVGLIYLALPYMKVRTLML